MSCGFLQDGEGANAHPAVVLGDTFTDLPVVHNWCLSDRTEYR